MMVRSALARRSTVAPSSTTQTSIERFTRLSKASSTTHAIDTKTILATGKVDVNAPLLTTPTTKKRKAVSFDLDDEPQQQHQHQPKKSRNDDSPSRLEVAIPITPQKSPVPALASTQSPTPATPSSGATPQRRGKRASTAGHTPHKSHSASTTTIISKAKRNGGKGIVCRKITEYQNIKRKTKQNSNNAASESHLPPAFADLISLHKAFLKTITLHIAHHGPNAPMDLREIIPHIARAWGKRQITVEDIRRCIAIEAGQTDQGLSPINDSAPSPFIIADYGRGKVCVEVSPAHMSIAINEETLHKTFEANLNQLYSSLSTNNNNNNNNNNPTASDMETDMDISMEGLNLQDLPQAPMTTLDTGAGVNPMLAKGQRALAELKNGILAKQQARGDTANTAATQPSTKPISLLDRLRLKQLSKSHEPMGLSGPELERRAALQRVEDVAAVISMLSLASTGGMALPRQAFALPALIEKLRDSLRVPVSREEGATCIRLLAAEIAPEWVRVVSIGGRENVVVQRTAQPVDRVIRERVASRLG